MSIVRATDAEVLLRREDVAYLRAKGLRADEIRAMLSGGPESKYPGLTLNKVFDDIEYIEKHAGEYIATHFLPSLGRIFMEAAQNLEMIRKESWRRYEDGEIEVHQIQDEDGLTIKRIHREGSSEWLKLAGVASKALLRLAERGPVIKEQARVMADYRRLLDKEKEQEAIKVAG